jgi:hypothetical protein
MKPTEWEQCWVELDELRYSRNGHNGGGCVFDNVVMIEMSNPLFSQPAKSAHADPADFDGHYRLRPVQRPCCIDQKVTAAHRHGKK